MPKSLLSVSEKIAMENGCSYSLAMIFRQAVVAKYHKFPLQSCQWTVIVIPNPCDPPQVEPSHADAQVHDVAMKKFGAIARAPLGSLRRKQEIRLRFLPSLRERVVKAGSAPDLAAQSAAIQAERKAQKRVRATAKNEHRKRRRLAAGPQHIKNK